MNTPQVYSEHLPDFKSLVTGHACEAIILFVVAIQVNVQRFLAAEFGRTAEVTTRQCVTLLNRLRKIKQLLHLHKESCYS